MAKFKRGDKVKVRLDSASPYRGRVGVVDKEPFADSYGLWYMVRFEWKDFAPLYRFLEQDLETVGD